MFLCNLEQFNEEAKMKGKVVSIQRKRVPGGVELIARSQSARGTRYISGSVVVLTAGVEKEEVRKRILAATEQLLGS